MPSAQEYWEQAQESVWECYEPAAYDVDGLRSYVAAAPDNLGLAFAALCLISTHDPASASAMLDRAELDTLSPETRFYLLSSVPYVLRMGDVMYQGDGRLGPQTRDFIDRLRQTVDSAALVGTGTLHATRLRDLFDSRAEHAENPDFGLALWHLSAYLLGSLDLRDREILAPMLDIELVGQAAFSNVMEALSLAANRDFLAELRPASGNEVTLELEVAAGAAARAWWESHDPTGTDAVLEGFVGAGFDVSAPLVSVENADELLRAAAQSEQHVIQYNALATLNEIFGASFDLERIMLHGKYGMSFFMPVDPHEQMVERVVEYWRGQIGGAP